MGEWARRRFAPIINLHLSIYKYFALKRASRGGGHRWRLISWLKRIWALITPFNPPLRSIRDQNSIKGLCLPLKEEGIVETRIESGMLKGMVFSHDKTGEKPTSLF